MVREGLKDRIWCTALWLRRAHLSSYTRAAINVEMRVLTGTLNQEELDSENRKVIADLERDPSVYMIVDISWGGDNPEVD